MIKPLLPKLLNIQNVKRPILFKLRKVKYKPIIYQLDWIIVIIIFIILSLLYYFKKKYSISKDKQDIILNNTLNNIKNY